MSFELLRTLADNNFAVGTYFDENFAAIETLLDGQITDDNVSASAEIDAGKIGDGGAVTQGEITTTGEANKIPKLNANAQLIANRIVFQEGV